MDLGIRDKRVLVVGASKGIGAATAKVFAEEGCQVIVVARSENKLKDLVDKMGGETRGHGYVVSDLLERTNPSKVVNELLEKYRVFDIVVHCVGGALGKKEILSPWEDWQLVWRFNVGIAIEMNAALIPMMQKQRWGRLVHISSISAQQGEPRLEPFGGAVPYAAAKAYLNAYVRGLGRELAGQNVIVSALMPGAVLSEGKFWDKMRKADPDLASEFIHRYQAIGRFGRPEEIASFAVFLASQQASFAAGSLVPVDGGRM